MSQIDETVNVRGGQLKLTANLPSEDSETRLVLASIFRAHAKNFENPSDCQTIRIVLGHNFETLSSLKVEFLPFSGTGEQPH